jgi:hypothetical protein
MTIVVATARFEVPVLNLVWLMTTATLIPPVWMSLRSNC